MLLQFAFGNILLGTISNQAFPPDQFEMIQQLGEELIAKMPPHFRAALHGTRIELQFQPLALNHFGVFTPSQKKGEAKITLDWSTAFLGSGNERHFQHSDPSLGPETTRFQLLQFTLMHELLHVVDHLDIQKNEFSTFRENCRRQRSSTDRIPPWTKECLDAIQVHTTVSTQPWFLELIHRRRTGFINELKRQPHAQINPRVMHTYQLEDEEEAFAMLSAAALLDPRFKCSYPSLFASLQKHLGYTDQFPEFSCEKTFFLYANASAEGFESSLIRVDPSRIHGVDFLLAGTGDGVISLFGHAMLRLIICDAKRKSVSEDCRKDVGSHLVVTFRGLVDLEDTGPLDKLSKKYPSLLFVSPFPVILAEYNQIELRDVVSYPMNLSSQEIQSLLWQVAESHWSYKGIYNFFSNNCADETLALLKRSLPDLRQLQNLETLRPDKMLGSLQEIALVQKFGESFPSKRKEYELSYSVLKNAVPRLKGQWRATSNRMQGASWKMFGGTLSTYWASSIEQRQQVLEDILKSSHLDQRSEQIASFLHLEAWIATAKSRELRKGIARHLLFPSNDSSADPENRRAWKELYALLEGPAALFDPGMGYGVPTTDELRTIDRTRASLRLLQNARILQASEDDLKKGTFQSTIRQIHASRALQKQAVKAYPSELHKLKEKAIAK